MGEAMFGKSQKMSLVEAENKALKQRLESIPELVAITRTGRLIKFTFVRNHAVYTIETMGLLSDDTEQWKKDLLS
jgi:hypothetical protein